MFLLTYQSHKAELQEEPVPDDRLVDGTDAIQTSNINGINFDFTSHSRSASYRKLLRLTNYIHYIHYIQHMQHREERRLRPGTASRCTP